MKNTTECSISQNMRETSAHRFRTPWQDRAAAILAGGRSRRFGAPKALARWGGGRVIDAVIRAIEAVCSTVIIVPNSPENYSDLDIRVIQDTFRGAGPLGGLHTALSTASTDRILIVGCDMPLLHPELLNWMWDLPTWAPIVVPRLNSRYEPLHTIYHRSLLRIVERRLKTGACSLQALIREIPHRPVTESEVARFCPDLSCLASANTLEELNRLEAIRSASPGSKDL